MKNIIRLFRRLKIRLGFMPGPSKMTVSEVIRFHQTIESKLMPDPKPQAPLPMTTGPLEPPTPKPNK
jgi:hypothetical protein